MIKLTNSRLLISLQLLLLVGMVLSCNKNDNPVNDGTVKLYSFGPTGAKHGDTISFIGVNLDKVSSISFTGTGATVDKKDFKVATSELLKLIVPTTAEKGIVTLKTPDGDIKSKTEFNLKVLSTIATITKNARPGGNVTITGNYLNWVDKITFNFGKEVSTFVSRAINQIVVKVPDDAQTGPLVLHYTGTDSNFVQTTDTLNVTLPVNTAMSPNPIKHGTNLTITGTDLDLVKKVYFTSVSAAVTTFVSQSATQLVVVVPASTTKGKVKLEAASGVQTTSSVDLDVVLPTITGMTPNPIDTSANLTITGTNLDLVSSVGFVGASSAVTTFVSQSATQLVVKVPGPTVTGKVTLNVKNSTLSVKSSNDLAIKGSSVPPIILYDDVLSWNGWVGGGWGGTKDLNNTSPVKSGSKSISISYTDGGWGVPLQLGGGNYPLGGYTSLKLSIYGGAGSSGKSVNIGFNEKDGKTVTIVEGQWTDFNIPLNQISPDGTLNFLYLKNYSSSGAFTIYVDNIGIY
ncbi:MAG: IPT/TIG domain-containing protein [Candidatus Dadabacteria bacterium]